MLEKKETPPQLVPPELDPNAKEKGEDEELDEDKEASDKDKKDDAIKHRATGMSADRILDERRMIASALDNDFKGFRSALEEIDAMIEAGENPMEIANKLESVNTMIYAFTDAAPGTLALDNAMAEVAARGWLKGLEQGAYKGDKS